MFIKELIQQKEKYVQVIFLPVYVRCFNEPQGRGGKGEHACTHKTAYLNKENVNMKISTF